MVGVLGRQFNGKFVSKGFFDYSLNPSKVPLLFNLQQKKRRKDDI